MVITVVALLTMRNDPVPRSSTASHPGVTVASTPAPPVATGDIFDQDAEGYLTFLGRVSDFIVRSGEKICLAAVRRVATQMPYVFSARTIVETAGDGKEAFVLELRTAVPAEPTEEEYAGMLRRWLRRAEMPRAIRLVADRAHAFSHK